MRFSNRCILFIFKFYKALQLFWKWVWIFGQATCYVAVFNFFSDKILIFNTNKIK